MSFNECQTIIKGGQDLIKWILLSKHESQNQLLTLVKNFHSFHLVELQSNLSLQKPSVLIQKSGQRDFSGKIETRLSVITKYGKEYKSKITQSTIFSDLRSHQLLSVLKKPGPFLIYRSITEKRKELSTCGYMICCLKKYFRYFSFWSILCRLGVRNHKIVKFRRYLKRFSYPWLLYSFPAAFILFFGDLYAQYCDKVTAPENETKCPISLKEFLKKEWNYERSLVYALLGMFLVGPIISKWNIILNQKLRKRNLLMQVLKKAALDVLILSPILLFLMAIIYDQKYSNIFKDNWEKTKNTVENSYIPAIKEILYINLLTRPIAYLMLCYIMSCSVPYPIRKYLKLLYEVWFAAYISSTFFKYRLREKPCPPEGNPKKLCRILNW